MKSTFYKNISENGGAMMEALKNQTPNSILVHSQTKKNGRMWGFSNPNVFLTNLEKNNGLYEIIHHFPHKVFFDIDEKEINDFDAFVKTTTDLIASKFPNADLAISGSHTQEKASLHVVLNNYQIKSEAERTHIKTLAKYICDNELPSCDWKVYTKNRNMKCINQSKLDGRIQSIIFNDDYKKHVITSFFNDVSLPLPILSEPIMEQIAIAKSKSTFDLALLPKLVLVCPENIDFNNITPEEVLSLLPINTTFSHDYTHLIARFCDSNKLSFEQFYSWYSSKNTTNYDKWKTHWSNLHKFPPVSLSRMKNIMATFYPHIKKDLSYRNFTQTFELPVEHITEIETINQKTFNSDKKYIIHMAGMGGGKTAQTITYLKDKDECIWIAPSKALALNTKKRFEDEKINVTHYLDVSTRDKKEGKLNNHNKLITVLNSLHYLTTKTYKIVIIDEIETLLDKFLGDFMEQGVLQLKKEIWQIFIKMIRSAEKVILLDAFITTKTLNFIKTIEGDLNKAVIYKRINEPQTRTVHYHSGFESSIHNAIQKLKDGSKIFIFYPYKKDSNNAFSMEKVYNMITEQTGKTGIFYNADVDDKTKTELKDVNEHWAGRDFVITNNILTCGVNYENLDFDYKFLFIASFNTPRDIIQVSYRARYLSTGKIYVCYMGKMNTADTWFDDCYRINCPIYTNLYSSILIEKKAPLKRAFQLFCVKAHYKQVTDKNLISSKIESEIRDLLKNQQAGYSYAEIEDIERGWASHLEEKCFAQEATMLDKIQLRKYFYQQDFTAEGRIELWDTENPTIQYAWDENYAFFFQQIKSLLLNPNNLFQKIATLNKLPNFFPENMKKIKLNEALLDQIFTEYKFRSLTRNSSVSQILKAIYNTFFRTTVIKASYESNKNISYSTNDEVNPLYDFCKMNMILDKNTYDVQGEIIDVDNVSDPVFDIEM
jgi:hypothetical protein